MADILPNVLAGLSALNAGGYAEYIRQRNIKRSKSKAEEGKYTAEDEQLKRTKQEVEITLQDAQKALQDAQMTIQEAQAKLLHISEQEADLSKKRLDLAEEEARRSAERTHLDVVLAVGYPNVTRDSDTNFAF